MSRFAAILLLFALFTGFLSAQEISDDRIYDQVRLRLTANADVNGGAIDVKVEKGVVTLQGKVRTEKAKSKAESLTSKVKGVKKVINQLVVSPT